MQPIRIAVAGASGMMGKIRLGQLLADPRVQVVAASARGSDALREAVGGADVRLCADPDELYLKPDVDAVAICLPNVLHYEHTKRALQAGKHVLCEYPLTNSLEQYDELVALADGAGLVLHHSLTVRAEALHRTLKAALTELGEPRCAYYRYYGTSSWYVKPELRGDMLCALHIHFMDQFVDLFGAPSRVVAHGVERDGKVSAVVMMQWESGLVGTVEFCMGFADKPGYMGTITTTDGWCGFETHPGMHVTVSCNGVTEVRALPGDTSKQEDMDSFLAEVMGTGGPQCDLKTGREAIALCLECSRQLASR